MSIKYVIFFFSDRDLINPTIAAQFIKKSGRNFLTIFSNLLYCFLYKMIYLLIYSYIVYLK